MMVTTTSIPANKMLRQLEGNTGKYTGEELKLLGGVEGASS
jgi:hypothetical protein